MQQVTCQQCLGKFPTNGMYSVFGRSLCEPCAKQDVAGRGGGVPAGAVQALVDPTVCRKCSADGSMELPRVAGIPVCGDCEKALRHRPFPMWVKCGFLALLCLAVAAFVVNLRFIQGMVEAQRALRAFAHGDLSTAASQMQAAASHVPESDEFRDLRPLFSAFALLHAEKTAAAIEAFHACMRHGGLRPELQLVAEVGLLQAEASAAFDAKDYDKFLALQEELAQKQPAEPVGNMGLASAHACKYAAGGDPQEKAQALELLAKVPADDRDVDVKKFRQRMLHRLQTREILSPKEFDQRFPNGWSAEGKP